MKMFREKTQGLQKMILFIESFAALNVLAFKPSSRCVSY